MWNGTMFVDLDLPLNASSLLSASAELLVSLFYDVFDFCLRPYVMLLIKTYQFKTYCKGDSHSSKTANIMIKERQTPLGVQVKLYSNSTASCRLKQLVSPNLNTIFRLYTFVNHA